MARPYDVICLVPVPEPLRDTLLRLVSTEWVRARLGDTAAETALLEKYLAAKSYDSRSMLVLPMAHSGSRKCLDALVQSYSSPCYYSNGPAGKRCRSLALQIAERLGLLYPEETVVTERLSRIRHASPTGPACHPDSVRHYTTEFSDWARRRLGIEVPMTGHPEILDCRCVY
jgi:hypothetical protein